MTSSAIQLSESSTLREQVYRATLPSGLSVFFCPKPGFQKKYASYSTFYGSVDNDFLPAGSSRMQVPDGIAHFLEHSLFETESGNVSDLFSLNGAYNNAATSFLTTTYLFASSDRFFENLGLLIDFVEKPAFHDDRVNKERGIIEQEITGYDDSADWVVYRSLLEGLFQKHPMRIDIAGTAESIASIDAELLQRCYRTFYHPANMCLFVTGDLDRTELFDFIASRSQDVSSSPAIEKRFYPDEPRDVAVKENELRMEVAQPKLLMGFKEVNVPSTGRDYVFHELVSDMALEILFGRSSDVFRELYEKQLILDDFSASYGAGAGVGYALVGGDSPDPHALRQSILDHAQRLRGARLDDADFAREKRMFIGSFIRGFNSLEYLANYYTHYRFHDFDLFSTIDLLHEVSRQDLEERIQELLDPDYVSSVVVLPST